MRNMENWQTPGFNGRLHRNFMVWEEANRVVMKLDMLNWLSTACPGKAEAGICETHGLKQELQDILPQPN